MAMMKLFMTPLQISGTAGQSVGHMVTDGNGAGRYTIGVYHEEDYQ
jgi:predicted NBD/HSP70 family sugar kinase